MILGFKFFNLKINIYLYNYIKLLILKIKYHLSFCIINMIFKFYLVSTKIKFLNIVI